MAIPTNESELADFSTNFNARLVATPATYGCTAGQATAYTAVHTPFLTAFEAVVAAREAGTRSSPLIATRNAAKASLLTYARFLYKSIQSNAAVTDASKIELGVVVPDVEPSPQPVPNFAPQLTIVSVNGRLVKVRLSDPAHPTRKRMPLGVDGATVMSFVGAEAPDDPGLYKYEGGTAKTTIDILFPESLVPGTQVWLTAFFFNERKQNGPACAGVGAIINYGGTMPMAA